jgi:hyperosmotically inducible periplasmic protein
MHALTRVIRNGCVVRFVHLMSTSRALNGETPVKAPKGMLTTTWRLATSLSLLALSPAFAAPQDNADNDNRAAEQPITDTWITAKVKTVLATTQGAKSLDLGVRTVDGAVALTGVLANELAVQKAIATTNRIKGVKSVDASGLHAEKETNPR